MLLGCCATRAAARQIGSWFEQACGRGRPVVDLPDGLLLAGVVLHEVLPGCVGLGRGLALGGSVAIALAGVAAVGKARRARVNRPDPDSDWVRPCQHEICVTTATQPGWNQPDQPAPAARLGWVSGKDKRYLMSWVWLGCSAIALVLVLWAKHVA
jgi:hypothetical protein